MTSVIIVSSLLGGTAGSLVGTVGGVGFLLVRPASVGTDGEAVSPSFVGVVEIFGSGGTVRTF